MRNEPLFIRTLVELADTLVDDFDVVDLLTLLSDRCVEVLDVSAAGIMLVSADGDLRVIASSSEAMRVVELFELQSDEGPCVDCYRDGALIMNQNLASARDRWPRFSPVALESGFQSAHTLPMRLRGRSSGRSTCSGPTPECSRNKTCSPRRPWPMSPRSRSCSTGLGSKLTS